MSRGIVRFFFGDATFGEKNQQEISSNMSTFHPEAGPIFSSKSRPKLILGETGMYRISFKNDILKKWQAALDASPGMAGGTSRKTPRKSDPIYPFPGSNTPAKVLKYLIFSFQNRCA